MALKLIVVSCLVTAALAGFLPYYGHPHQTIIKHVQPEAPANYEFNYNVNEASTGDVHSQKESAKDGAIWGSYELNDADGFRRIVDYTADDVHGFQANVRREPLAPKTTIIKKIIQPHITKIVATPAHAPWYQPYQAAYHAW